MQPSSAHKKKLQKKIRAGRKARLLFDAEKQRSEKKKAKHAQGS
ncbi:MAG: hypothetical protein N3H30_02760 [Candidatus Micrarchaeota archaeon]|nr:hypothetical protein [Candidatus Micrarchaeota archaeon]